MADAIGSWFASYSLDFKRECRSQGPWCSSPFGGASSEAKGEKGRRRRELAPRHHPEGIFINVVKGP